MYLMLDGLWPFTPRWQGLLGNALNPWAFKACSEFVAIEKQCFIKLAFLR